MVSSSPLPATGSKGWSVSNATRSFVAWCRCFFSGYMFLNLHIYMCIYIGFGVWVVGFVVWGLGFVMEGFGFRVYGSGLKV